MIKLLSAEIITIGDEILLGQIVDTNSAWMAQRLTRSGVQISKIVSVTDEAEAIRNALVAAEARAKIVLITGGLGPTSDDITKDLLHQYFGGEMLLDPEVLADVRQHFSSQDMPEINLKQAQVPSSCRVLRNKCGTAPGMWFQRNDCHYIAMPGVPREMRGIMEDYVLPFFTQQAAAANLYMRSVLVCNYNESQLMEKIGHWEAQLPPFKLAYLPSPSLIRLRLTLTNSKQQEAATLAAAQIEKLHSILGDDLLDEQENELENIVARLLRIKGLTLSVAESCTGGYLAHLLSRWDGSSDFFCGGLVAYSCSVKNRLLGVDAQQMELNGAVTALTAEQMAVAARQQFSSNVALATTGLLGAVPANERVPSGTVWLALACEAGVKTRRLQLHDSDRLSNITRVSHQALLLLRSELLQGFVQ